MLEQIGKEAGVKYVDSLRDDDLPNGPGDAHHSYLALMAEDVKTMTTALGGNPALIADFDTANVPGLDKTVTQEQ